MWPFFFTVNSKKLLILGDHLSYMLNWFHVLSVLIMEVFCCYECAFSAGLRYEEQGAKLD